MFGFLRNALPNDHSYQTNSTRVVTYYVEKGFSPETVLDFGCREGDSISFFENLLPQSHWTGVDIHSRGIKPDKSSRTPIFPYNDRLPFKNNSFDLIYSHLALEHIPSPQKTLAEISRVLNNKGLLIGQTSQFGSHQSLNRCNYTIFGFKQLIEKTGLKILELRPGIDSITLLKRSYTWDYEKYNKFFSIESPINQEINQIALNKKESHQMTNYKKLLVSGQFCFVCSLK